MDDDQGTSLVLINTDKGASSLPSDNIKITEEEFHAAIKKNSAWSNPAAPHHRRAEFFRHLTTEKGIIKQIAYALRPTIRQRMTLIKHPRTLIKKLLQSLMGGKLSL